MSYPVFGTLLRLHLLEMENFLQNQYLVLGISDKLPGISGIGILLVWEGVNKLDQDKWEFPC